VDNALEAGRLAAPGGRRWSLDTALVGAALVVAIIGVGIATYLAFENVQGQSGVCTGVAASCEKVQQSSYGKWFGVPVSVPGVGLYLALVGAALVWLTDLRGWRSYASFAGFNFGLVGVIASIYFTSIEAFVLHAYCIYCLTSAGLLCLSFGLWTAVVVRERARSNE
jgi:uncharacterized membrane protein